MPRPAAHLTPTHTTQAPNHLPHPTCVSSSVFMRREASCSLCPPRAEHRESISSMKMTQGSEARAISNRKRTSFSDSPLRGRGEGEGCRGQSAEVASTGRWAVSEGVKGCQLVALPPHHCASAAAAATPDSSQRQLEPCSSPALHAGPAMPHQQLYCNRLSHPLSSYTWRPAWKQIRS